MGVKDALRKYKTALKERDDLSAERGCLQEQRVQLQQEYVNLDARVRRAQEVLDDALDDLNETILKNA